MVGSSRYRLQQCGVVLVELAVNLSYFAYIRQQLVQGATLREYLSWPSFDDEVVVVLLRCGP